MIGGIVVETVIVGDRVWINCEEERSSSQCAIYVKNTAKARCVSPGDTVWWQGVRALWTPHFNRGKTCDHTHHYSCKRVGKDYDIELERIGFSGVPKPS